MQQAQDLSMIENGNNESELKSSKDSVSSTDEMYGFFQCKFIMSYLLYFVLFGIGWFTPHFIQLWFDFSICSLYSLIIYCSNKISNKWILFLILAFTH